MRILGGKFKLREIKTPKGMKTRPTIAKLKRSIFDSLQSEIVGSYFLDLFAGSGAMGIEALSRGAGKVTFVEKDQQAMLCIKENLQKLKIEDQAEILFKDAAIALKQLVANKTSFHLIYIDPPYNYDLSSMLDSLASLLNEDGLIIVEQRKNVILVSKSLQEKSRKEMGDTVVYFFSKL